MTKNLDDGYMGSGKRLGYAKKKYGIENFKKEILSTHETPEEMLAEECRLVNEEFLGRNDVYNLTCGGRGSWFYVNLLVTHEQRIDCGKKGGAIAGKLTGHQKHWKNKRPLMMKNAIKGVIAAASINSNEKRKTTFSKICHQSGSSNSQFGTMWITNGVISKKIKSDQLIESGWTRGRHKADLCLFS